MTTALTPEQIRQRLRYQGKQYSAGVFARGGAPERHYLEQAADCIEALEAELAACKRDAEWNRLIISSVDKLLGHAGYEPDCSIRIALSGMRFDAAMAAQEQK